MRDAFRQYLLPGIVFQSVLIGGAYATGREIVEYGARFGAMGIWSILAIATGFSLMAILSYEVARSARVYDYRNFVGWLIGPLWPLFDAVYALMVLVTIAVVSAASGRVMEEVLGWSYWMGVALVMVLVAALEMGGRHLIERFKAAGSLLLYGFFGFFAGWVMWHTWDNIEAVFLHADASSAAGVSTGAILWTGILYVGYNLGAMPATLFVLDYQTHRRHAVVAGLVTGILATVPFILTYFAVLGYYPDGEVLQAEVPWLVMLRKSGGAALAGVYAVVILWTLVETSTGMIHAVLRRIDTHMEDRGRKTLTRMQTGLMTAGILLGAALLSRFGIIALVSKGYGALAWGFLLLFAFPLLTVGVARMLWRKKQKGPGNKQSPGPFLMR